MGIVRARRLSISRATIAASWARHRRTIWILHSIWALAAGAGVLWLARERYGFVYWVVGFLVTTWLTTLFFGARPPDAPVTTRQSHRREFLSYLTRVMYHETLFFLLPFYAYSTVFPSWNMGFIALLAVLAVAACLDLVFDRWLRESPVFGFVFFASVAFGALNLLLPMLFPIDPSSATLAAAIIAVTTAVPLAARGHAQGTGGWLRVGAATVAILVVAVWFRVLVPPVPLRLQEIAFGHGIDRGSLELTRPITGETTSDSLGGRIVVRARVFAPTNVPARVALDWYLNDALVRTSREVEIVAHAGGFRLWDSLQPDEGTLTPGVYTVTVRTADDRVFGTASVRLR